MPAGTRVLPVPVALERFEYEPRHEAKRFAFICGPAMLDRNGLDLLFAAIEHVESVIEIEIHGSSKPINGVTFGGVHGNNVVTTFHPATAEYWDTLDTHPDVLIMPRRYGGLSLPVQEAAAQGIPSIMLDVRPHFPGCLRVPSFPIQVATMKGGMFPVNGTDPKWLANAIDFLAETPSEVRSLSDDAWDWAQRISWDMLQPAYEEVFRGSPE